MEYHTSTAAKPSSGEVQDALEPNRDDPWLAHRKHYGRYRSLQARKTLLQDAMSELRGSASDFDKTPYLFNCLNGTLDLRTGELRPHDPRDMISEQAAVNFNPSAASPRFVRFIEEITEGNQERARMLQKALGYALKGEANEECYFTAIGEKTRNGKGTLFDTMLRLFIDELRSGYAWQGTGWTAFLNHGGSSVERAAEKTEDLIQRLNTERE